MTNPNRVKRDVLADGRVVSTVRLPLDHSFGNGPPLWYETMVFPSEENFMDSECHRYTTKDQAEAGHSKVVERLSKEN